MQLDLLPEDVSSLKRKALSAPKKSRPLVQENPHKRPEKTAKKENAPTDMSSPERSEEHVDEKAPGAFKTISEVAQLLDVPQHVLRFWESRFSQIKPLKLRGGRRYYRPQDIETLTTIQHLLYKQGYTIKGAKKAFAKKEVPAAATPEKEIKEAKSAAKPGLSDRQQSQLTVIRQELVTMRDILKPYLTQ